MATDRFRMGFKFWLNVDNEAEHNIAEKIEALKARRTFAKTIRDGIRLICDLRAGRWDVLRELFPWVIDAIYDAVQADILAQTPPMAKLDDAPVPDALQARLDRLEQLLLQQGALPIEQQPPALTPIPLLPDDEPKIEVREAQSDEKPAYNFLRSLQAQMVTRTNVVEKVPPKLLSEDPLPMMKAMDVPYVAVPTFDDDDEDVNLLG